MESPGMEVNFDPEHYQERIEASRHRLHLARTYQEPDRVPITFNPGGSFYCQLFGVNIRDYYQAALDDPDLQLEVQLKSLRWAFEELQDDRTECDLRLDLGPVGEAYVFDLPVEWADHTSPWIARTMSVPEAAEKLQVVDPDRNPGVQKVYQAYERMKARVEELGLKVAVNGGLSIQPPLSAACSFLDMEEVFSCLATEPQLVHQLFEKLLLSFFRLRDYQDRYFGTRTNSIELVDDQSAYISDTMYRQHIMPYNMMIYARYGQQGRGLRADGPNDHHFLTYANVVRLSDMDIGGFSDMARAKLVFSGKVFFSGGLNYDDLHADFAAARPVVDQTLRIGMPGGGYALGVGGETYAGVNPDTLCQVVAHAREVGVYPLKAERFGDRE